MPEQISVDDFLQETWDDYKQPTASNFINRMGQCRHSANLIEEGLDFERSGLSKMKKSVKALHSSGNMHVANESYLAENLERLGSYSINRENEADIGAAFLKFAVVTKELSALMKNMMQNINNILVFPLDSFLKGDLRGVKGDLKKPFDKASKEYDNKFNKIEKERKKQALEAGLFKTEVSGAEVAEEMEKERRLFQLQMCEYLIKVNEIKTKKGVDLLQHLVEYYQAQNNFFQDGLKTIDHFRCYIEELVGQLGRIRQRYDAEKRQLVELRDALKSSMQAYKESYSHVNPNRLSTSSVSSASYSLHQLQGNKAHGCNRTGFLLKKSDGKMRKVWQRRRCSIQDGTLSISHSDTSKEPVKLNLLTCQVKLIPDDPGKKCFDLISSSKNRTYHFQADDTRDMEEWISVLNNAREAIFNKAFEGESSSSCSINQSLKELTRTIIHEVRRLPGNRICCDCGAPDPEWLSVNLGVLICLECCGVHRQMGVHISRTQSIVIDDLGTSQLLLARVVSNRGFNDIMEATLDMKHKPSPSSDMEERKAFIRAKYEKRRFAIVTCADEDDRRLDLKQAILTKDIYALLQVFAEGIDFMDALPDTERGETALHLAIQQEDGSTLYMVDFILQNSNSQRLKQGDMNGDTALHVCAQLNQTECMKLLLRVQPDLVNYENQQGLTALEVAQDRHTDLCAEMINNAIAGKTDQFDNVNVDWHLIQDDHLYDTVDYSDDDLDGSNTPERKCHSRPGSLILMADGAPAAQPQQQGYRERSSTADSLKVAPSGGVSTASSNSSLASGRPKGSSAYSSSNEALSGGGGGVLLGPTGTLTKKKAPAPPPPTYLQGHTRNTSDPCGLMGMRGHSRSPSDPPPLPSKANLQTQGHRTLPGQPQPHSKVKVLPPPPEFRENDGRVPHQSPEYSTLPSTKPRPVPARRQSEQVSNPSSPVDFAAGLRTPEKRSLSRSKRRLSDVLDSHQESFFSLPSTPSKEEEGGGSRRLSITQSLLNAIKIQSHACDVCGKTFKRKDGLKAHMRLHTAAYVCGVCGKNMASQSMFAEHMKRRHSSHTCSTCGKVFPKKTYLTAHEKSHRQPQDTCTKAPPTSSVASEHKTKLRSTAAAKLVGAPGDNSKSSLQDKAAHFPPASGPQPEIHTCDECGKKFRSKHTLHVHQRVHLREEQRGPSELCSTTSGQVVPVNKRRRHCTAATAQKKKAFECSQCRKRFTLRSSLRRHTTMHHPTSGRNCEVCQGSFSSSSLLALHKAKCHLDKVTARPPVHSKRMKKAVDIEKELVAILGPEQEEGKEEEIARTDPDGNEGRTEDSEEALSKNDSWMRGTLV